MSAETRTALRSVPRPARRRRSTSKNPRRTLGFMVLLTVVLTFAIIGIRDRYTFSLQSPVQIHFRWPLVISVRTPSEAASEAQADQFGRRLSAYQQYACTKFGPDCRIALAIQRAENPRGACEIYHYNSDGSLDWGYFQINTVHLKRAGVNLRSLLDCKANIDFAFQLYQERGFAPWSTYNSGAYQQFLRNH
jgi:hypothetical protein